MTFKITFTKNEETSTIYVEATSLKRAFNETLDEFEGAEKIVITPVE